MERVGMLEVSRPATNAGLKTCQEYFVSA